MRNWNSAVRDLRDFCRKGGPEPREYHELMDIFSIIMAEVRGTRGGETLLHELWPTLGDAFWSTSTVQGLGILKPRGYAGDFELIDRLYTRWMSPREDLVRWDRFLHSRTAVRAVRNRKEYFRKELVALTARAPGHEVRVASIGCGPARECAEAVKMSATGHSTLSVLCLDHDRAALSYAARVNGRVGGAIEFRLCNAFRWRPDPEGYDFIWSAGLFDYLSDAQFTFLMGKLVRALRPGGRLVVGNFGPENPTRDYMEFGQWMLHHRSGSQLEALASDLLAAGEAQSAVVSREPEGVNLFLHLQRA